MKVGSERFECPYCGKTVGSYVPKGGDGSAVRLRWHKNNQGQPCEGRFEILDRMGNRA